MELNENRRKARSLLTYFNRVSGLVDNNKQDGTQVTNFFSAKNTLLKVNEIPLELKAEIRQQPTAIWDNLEGIIDVLKKVCSEESENKKLKEFEKKNNALDIFLQNLSAGGMSGISIQHFQGTDQGSNSQFLDAMVDYFDDTVPDDLKNQFTEKQKEAFDFLCDQIGEEKLDFIKNHEGLLDDIILTFVQAVVATDYPKMIKQIVDFNKKMDEVISVNEMLEPFAQSLGIGMNELFHKKGFSELHKYALLLEKQKEIKELAELLGHQEADEKDTDKKSRDSIKYIESRYHPRPSYRGNIVGFSYSGDIGKVVPTEIALLKNQQTEMLFYHKFAEKQLLSYNYEMSMKGEINKDKALKKGPVIMAIDTSGSMNGQPEKIAKIVAIAITKIALKEKRKCFLISFSSQIKVMDLSDFYGSNGLTNLTNFLGHSFNGGTDVEPCMKAALDQLEKNNFDNADILFISDFEMYNFENKTVERILEQKKNGTKLYSLLIGTNANGNVLRYFDEQWRYTGKKGERITFLHEIKNKLEAHK